MAGANRNTHRLATVRILLRPSRGGLNVELSSFIGKDELETREVSADAIGIQSELSVRAYRNARFEVPDDVLRPIVDAFPSGFDSSQPFWLQIGSSAGHLGVVPWEQYFQPALGRPLLRIPNFVADPVFLGGRLRAAIVVSSPRAKTPFSVEQYARDLISLAQQAVPQGTELHVFADQEAYNGLQALSAPPGHAVVVHDPQEADGQAEASAKLAPHGLEARIDSPWLQWIRRAAGGAALDLVHFVSPGFFRRDQGALALARSPVDNQDRRWSHFIGADELIAFLDLVGAWSVGFSPPYENVWAIGLRLLADRLAWKRPGPLFVHDSDHGTPDDLVGVYRFLFASNDEVPPVTPSLSLYSHPRRMSCYRTGDADVYESIASRSFELQPDEPQAQRLRKLMRRDDSTAQAAGTSSSSAWAQSNDLQLDRMLMKLGRSDTPGRRGALSALEEVRRIFEDAKKLDGQPPPPTRSTGKRAKADDEEGGQALGGTSA